MSVDENTAGTLVDAFIDAGGNVIDTADVYGAAEGVLGRILKGKREKVAIATKVGGPKGAGPFESGLSRKHIIASLETSLKLLQTDYIDLYQIHRWQDTAPIEESLRALDDCVRAGKVRYLGCSNVTGWQLATALGVANGNGLNPFISLQPEYNLLSRGADRELLPAAEYYNLGVLPWSPLAGGLLTGKYSLEGDPPEGSRGVMARMSPFAEVWNEKFTEHNFEIIDMVRTIAQEAEKTMVQVGIRWLLDDPPITAPIIGPKNMDQLNDYLGALGWQLDPEHKQRLDEVSEIKIQGYPYDSFKFFKKLERMVASGSKK
jgi:aryl-alcohol dehydrogenase-like predicted oxidoreductase